MPTMYVLSLTRLSYLSENAFVLAVKLSILCYAAAYVLLRTPMLTYATILPPFLNTTFTNTQQITNINLSEFMFYSFWWLLNVIYKLVLCNGINILTKLLQLKLIQNIFTNICTTYLQIVSDTKSLVL